MEESLEYDVPPPLDRVEHPSPDGLPSQLVHLLEEDAQLDADGLAIHQVADGAEGGPGEDKDVFDAWESPLVPHPLCVSTVARDPNSSSVCRKGPRMLVISWRAWRKIFVH